MQLGLVVIASFHARRPYKTMQVSVHRVLRILHINNSVANNMGRYRNTGRSPNYETVTSQTMHVEFENNRAREAEHHWTDAEEMA